MRIIAYFRELLETLKRIEIHLRRLAECVQESSRDYGDKRSISVTHWNDGGRTP